MTASTVTLMSTSSSTEVGLRLIYVAHLMVNVG